MSLLFKKALMSLDKTDVSLCSSHTMSWFSLQYKLSQDRQRTNLTDNDGYSSVTVTTSMKRHISLRLPSIAWWSQLCLMATSLSLQHHTIMTIHISHLQSNALLYRLHIIVGVETPFVWYAHKHEWVSYCETFVMYLLSYILRSACLAMFAIFIKYIYLTLKIC